MTAVSLFTPKSLAPNIVAADRETPGIIDKDCTSPIKSACLVDIFSMDIDSFFTSLWKISTIIINKPPIKSDKTVISSFPSRYSLINLYRIKPIMPVGIKAIIIFFQISLFWSKRFLYKKIIASIAPSWIIISKLFKKLLSGIESNFPAKIRCPVDDIGRNSVKPSTIDNIIAWR